MLQINYNTKTKRSREDQEILSHFFFKTTKFSKWREKSKLFRHNHCETKKNRKFNGVKSLSKQNRIINNNGMIQRQSNEINHSLCWKVKKKIEKKKQKKKTQNSFFKSFQTSFHNLEITQISNKKQSIIILKQDLNWSSEWNSFWKKKN